MSTDHAKHISQAEAAKKLKRLGIKKSALRHKDTPRQRRKRVSLVIDGQTVLPADTVIEPPLTSPSSETTSVSNSTASLDELIDPRLTRPDLNHDAVHHSLPVSMSNSHSPTKPLAETPTTGVVIQSEQSPPLSIPRSSSIPLAPPTTATRTFLDPSPSQWRGQSIPRTAGSDPIYPDTASTEQLEIADLATEDTEDLKYGTYVGGLHGSGVDDLDQAGSYGYPSSLGASYLESYMQSRPLSVRMQAADEAERDERETRVRRQEEEDDRGNQPQQGRRGNFEAQDEVENEDEEEEFHRANASRRPGDDDDDMDITGSMEF